MNFEVTNINIRYENGDVAEVHVYFSGYNHERTFNIGGHVPLTADEYTGNESLVALNSLVRERVAAIFATAS